MFLLWIRVVSFLYLIAIVFLFNLYDTQRTLGVEM